ncbi:MAG: LemA family protein [Candidatus Gracilibacteria bacterium]|jgi:LemA protein
MFTLLLVIIAVLAALVAILYNSLVKLRNKCNEAWADIDTQLKRRYDLIPNLVETVKGYASHEAGTLEKVTQARNTAMNAKSMKEREQAENMLSDTLKSIFALSEQYPDLKANQNFLDLQKTLKEVEEQLQLSRRYYNATVRDMNNQVQTFPNNLFASKLGFAEREFFQATDEEKKSVKVSFSDQVAQGAKDLAGTAKNAAGGVVSVVKPQPAPTPAPAPKPAPAPQPAPAQPQTPTPPAQPAPQDQNPPAPPKSKTIDS